MKAIAQKGFCFFVAICASAVMAQEELPLPEWESSSQRRGWLAGELLLSFDPIEEEIIPRASNAESANEGLSITSGLALRADKPLATAMISQYFGKKATSFLVDPQHLIPTADLAPLKTSLDIHSEDSAVRLFVYVFTADQKISANIRAREDIEKFYAKGKPTIISFYYLGLPQRTEIYLTPALADKVSLPEQRRALQSSVIRALRWKNPSKQLQAYIDQLSVRAYWMERQVIGGKETSELQEEVMIPTVIKAEKNVFMRKQNLNLIIQITGIILVILISGSLVFLFVRRFRTPQKRTIPTSGVTPRLGAKVGAGLGPIISFSANASPPAEQWERLQRESGEI